MFYEEEETSAERILEIEKQQDAAGIPVFRDEYGETAGEKAVRLEEQRRVADENYLRHLHERFRSK